MSDETHAFRTILRAIDGFTPGCGITIDLIRDQCDAARLSSAEKAGALTRACREGYLTGVFLLLPWWSLDPIHAAVPSTNPSRKGGHHLLYRRTEKAVPEHVCREVALNG